MPEIFSQQFQVNTVLKFRIDIPNVEDHIQNIDPLLRAGCSEKTISNSVNDEAIE